MKNSITKKLVSMGLIGTLLFAGAIQAVAIDPSFEVENTREKTPLAVTQSSYPLEYEVNEQNTAVTITTMDWTYHGEFTIPSKIDGLPVTSIGTDAFWGCHYLTSITIPNTVKTIDEYAFSGCSSLTSITIPNSVITIGKWAFDDCTGLTAITIPNSVKFIGDYAFAYCTNLTSITMPDSLLSVNEYAFNSTGWYDAQPDGLVCLNNWLIGYKGEMAENTSLSIPNSVKYIADKVFSKSANLTSVTIPNSVKFIGDSAFSYCTALTAITLPDSLTSIGVNVFNSCSGLTSFIIPNSVTAIGEKAFFACSAIENLTIGNAVKSIGKSAFCACRGLETVTIPNSTTTIGDYAFGGCMGLKTVIMPNSVKTIGDSAFAGCSELVNINLPISLTRIENNTFARCLALPNIEIPSTVTFIGDAAFNGCGELTSITIPKSVNFIGEYAFFKCATLTDVVLPNSVKDIKYRAFSCCYDLQNITIPNSVTAIDETAFDSSDNLTVLCAKDSYAKTFAQENNIPYKEIELDSNLYAMKLESTKAYNNGVLEDTNESTINGVAYKAKLQFNNFKTFLPTRSVAESMGLEVGYDIFTGATTISNSTKTVKVVPNSNNVIVVENGVTTTVNAGVAPIYVKGALHIPVKAVIEQFGFFVNWHADGYLLITDYEVASNEIDALKAKVATVL